MAYQIKKKSVKKTPFLVYMEENRTEVEASGRKPTRGNAELAEHYSKGWKEMLPYEKALYEDKAKKHNQAIKFANLQEVARVNKMRPGEHPLNYSLRMERELIHWEFREQCQLNREIVRNMFETKAWILKPIVVCKFAVFFEPNSSEISQELIPAEIGLAAFSLQDGIIDNYCRLIDPGNSIPTGRRGDAYSTVEQMGLPDLGTCDELKLYGTLHSKIKIFLETYTEESPGNYFVFALNRDLEKVTRCFEWISAVVEKPLPVKVLSLSLWAHLASTENNEQHRQASEVEPGNSLMDQEMKKLIQASMLTLPTLSNRLVEKPLTSVFYYPSQYPSTQYGLLPHEELVDEIVGKTDNYKYYDELCCMYHMKCRKGIQYCALNACNRFIYSLLEILTISNNVDIRRGAHFPTIDNLAVERERRLYLLKGWGVTELEWRVKDENLNRRYEEVEYETQDKVNPDEPEFQPMDTDVEIDMKNEQPYEHGNSIS